MVLLDSPKKFMDRLGIEARRIGIPDLEEKLDKIKSSYGNYNLWKDFLANPIRKDSSGEFVYFVGEDETSTENLLENFSWNEVCEICENSPIIKKGGRLVSICGKVSGKINLLPDTNIIVGPFGKLSKLQYNPAFSVDLLTIVREEAAPRGLKRYQIVPPELLKGEQSIISRLGGQSESYIEGVIPIYRCIWDYYVEAINGLNETLELYPEWSDKRIAQQVSKRDYEVDFYEKQVRELRSGYKLNSVADRLLVASSYVLNMADSRDVAVVITSDGDLECISNLMHDEIIPLYMARGAYSTLESANKRFVEEVSIDSFISAARQHLRISENEWSSQQNCAHSAGIVYNPRTDSFDFSTLPQAYVNYIHNISLYRPKKQEIIAASALLSVSPIEALRTLYGIESEARVE